MLEVRFLGQFDVRQDGSLIEIPSRPAQSLFAYLILNAGIASRREKLAGLLWPDSPESNARNNLRQALWRLRRTFDASADTGADYLDADSFAIAFNSESNYWLDVKVLEKDLAADSPADALADVVSNYRGELLPGFYDEWVTLERERVEAAFDDRMGALLRKLLEAGRWQECLAYAERWISLGKAPEPAFRALMIAHSQLGDLSRAADAYQRCVESLREQLGVEPSPETQKLFQDLAHGEVPAAVQAVRGAEPAPVPRPAALPPFLAEARDEPEPPGRVFVARDQELSHLGSLLRSAIDGEGQVAFITGEPGSGKTALLREFAQRAQEEHAEVIVTFGRCNALTGIGDPYLPFREALTLLAGDVEARWLSGGLSTEQASRLWASFPRTLDAVLDYGPDLIESFIPSSVLLAQVRAPGVTGWHDELERLLARRALMPVEARLEQKDLFEQFTRVLHSLASVHPLILILDDLQWADLGSVSLLFHLGRRIRESRVLILGAFRAGELTQAHPEGIHPLRKVTAEFKRTFGDFQIDLERTKEAEGRTFINAFLDTETNLLDDRFRSELHRHTGGQPLFTIELLRSMEARGDLFKDDQGRWVPHENLDWGSLPARVEGVIEERVGRLRPSLREMLTAASVEGEVFTAEVLARLLAVEESEVLSQLSGELNRQHRLVVAEGSRRIDGRRLSLYRFRHILFQKHLYNNLDAVERPFLHERVGQALEVLYGDWVEEISVPLARHFTEAGIAEKAVVYLNHAGERAIRLSATEEALGHLSRGLELLKQLPDGPAKIHQELRLLPPLGISMIASKGYTASEVESIFSRARQLCRLVGESPRLGPVLFGLRSYYLVRADYKTAFELGEQLLALGESSGETGLLLAGHEAVGSSLFYYGRLPEARKHLEEGCRLYDPYVHKPLTYLYGQDNGVAGLSYLALTLWALGLFDQARARGDAAVALAQEVGHPYSLGFALFFSAFLHAMRRERKLAQQRADASISLSTKYGFPIWQTAGRIVRGWTLAEQGLVGEGTEDMHVGLQAWEAMGAELGTPLFLTLWAEVLSKVGRVDEALAAVEKGLGIARRTGERVSEPELYRIQGDLLYQQGATSAEVETHLQHAVDLARQQSIRAFELRAARSLGRLWVEHGNPAHGVRLLQGVLKGLTEGSDIADVEDARARLIAWTGA